MFSRLQPGQPLTGLSMRNDPDRKTADTVYITDPLTGKIFHFHKVGRVTFLVLKYMIVII